MENKDWDDAKPPKEEEGQGQEPETETKEEAKGESGEDNGQLSGQY
jgi:hypothetical protein